MIELNSPSLGAVVDEDVEAAPDGDDQLFEGPVRMATSDRTLGNVIEVVDARDREGDMSLLLDEGEVSLRVLNDRQLDKLALTDAQERWHPSSAAAAHRALEAGARIGVRLAAALRGANSLMPGVHPSAIVEADSIGAGVSIGEFAVVRPGAVLGDGVTIHPGVVIAEEVEVGPGTEVLPGAFLGRVPRAVGSVAREPSFRRWLRIGANCSIGPNAVLYFDLDVGAETLIGDAASVRELSRIGEGCIVGRGATVDRDVEIGDGSRIMDQVVLTGKTRVGRDVFVAARVVTTNDSSFGRNGYVDEDVQGPTIEDGAMIGGGASLLPGVVIGRTAIVGSGAVVTKDVEPGGRVFGVPARPVG